MKAFAPDSPLVRVENSDVDIRNSQSAIDANMRQSLQALSTLKSDIEGSGAQILEVISLLKATFDAATDGIAVVNSSEVLVAFNRSFAAIWGFPDYLQTGIHVWDFSKKAAEVFFDSASSPVERLKAQFKSPNVHYADEVSLLDGRTFSRHSIPHFAEGKWMGTVIAWRDITHQRRAERALLTQEENHRTLLHGLQEGVALISRENGIVEANAKAEEIAGRTIEEMRGHFYINPDWIPIRDDGSIVPEDERVIRTAFRTSRAQSAQIHGFKKPTGEVVWLSINATPLQTKSSESVTSVVVSFSDVTTRKNSDLRRAELESQLRASQKMESLGTLAGGIAHDFNNILSAILGNVAVAKIKNDSPGDVAISLNEIEIAANRAKELVRKILTFSRQGIHAPTVQRLEPLVSETIGILQATIPAGITINLTVNSPNLWVAVDATELSQVLLNLCTNSKQAIGSNTGRILVNLDSVEVSSKLVGALCELPPGKYAQLRVSDDGCGMTTETIARMFEPFFTTKSVEQGTGLGLSVVHGIITRHGGCIFVKSILGAGTDIDVYLPEMEEPSNIAPSPNSPVSQSKQTSKRRVMYVDDEEPMVYMVHRFLTLRGFTVFGFTNPALALEAFREAPARYDVVVTDQNMPGFSGIALSKKLRAIRESCPIVITSGYIDSQLLQEAEALGIKHVLYKPNTVQELCEIIHTTAEAI